jgi:hypothetical protein
MTRGRYSYDPDNPACQDTSASADSPTQCGATSDLNWLDNATSSSGSGGAGGSAGSLQGVLTQPAARPCLDDEFLALMDTVGYLFMVLGAAIFNQLLASWPYRSIFVVTQTMLVGVNFLDLVVRGRWYFMIRTEDEMNRNVWESQSLIRFLS